MPPMIHVHAVAVSGLAVATLAVTASESVVPSASNPWSLVGSTTQVAAVLYAVRIFLDYLGKRDQANTEVIARVATALERQETLMAQISTRLSALEHTENR